jgi:hypothetical protein
MLVNAYKIQTEPLPEVRQSVRDLHNTLGRMFVAKRDFEDDREKVRKELDPAYRKLLSACDKALKREVEGNA